MTKACLLKLKSGRRGPSFDAHSTRCRLAPEEQASVWRESLCSAGQQQQQQRRSPVMARQPKTVVAAAAADDGMQAAEAEPSVEAADPVKEEFEARYKLEEPLGAGSFGEVFNGWDRVMEQYVAIKEDVGTKRGSLAKEYERYKRLKNRLTEPLLLSLHPRGCARYAVPEVFGFYQTNSKSYLVMEKMGPSLEHLYQQCSRKFSLGTVCRIALQLLDRIEVVHAAGMLHRDIKPDNFVIGCPADTRVGTNFIRILDFGLSNDYKDDNGVHIAEKQGTVSV